jgi:hypothetical protein
MIRKAHIIGILVLGLMATAAGNSPAVAHFVSSARNIERNLRDGGNSGTSLSRIERLVFSLVLERSNRS